MAERESLIPKHGGYRNLKSFQVAQLVYDVTVLFCDTHISTHSRTQDQMVQAARSGEQNIAEGSKASGTSRASELKLTNVARASLEELRLDYEDFLRQHGLPLWDRQDPRRADLIAQRPKILAEVQAWVHWARQQNGQSGPCGHRKKDLPSSTQSTLSTESTQSSLSSGETLANGALALVNVATYLLTRQLASQAVAFEHEGGFTERLYERRHIRRER